MLIVPKPDGSASVMINGDLVTVNPADPAEAMRTLLETIAQLEARIDKLERKAK